MLVVTKARNERPFVSQPPAGHQQGLKHCILVAGSSEKSARQIADGLSCAYRIILSESLRNAHSLISDCRPEIIVIDYTTSHTNVLQLCYQLKLNPLSNHIPVILVADQLDFQSRLIALQYGATDCLSGATYPEELIWRIRNLIQLCCNVQSSHAARFTVSGACRTDSLPNHLRLRMKITEVMEKNIADPQFSVVRLAREVGLSKVQLYRKVNELTGHTPSEYIRVFRLQRAAELLLTEAGNIGEVAYRVGFSNLSYFSKCFRKLHGCQPGEHLRKVKSTKRHSIIGQMLSA